MTNDLLPCREAFEKWLDSRHISADKSPDAWGSRIYKHSHVQAMWEAWEAASSAPNKPAEVDLIPDRTDEILVSDLQTTLRMFNSRKEPLSASEITTTLGTEKLIQIIDFALRYYRAALSGHLATGKGGAECTSKMTCKKTGSPTPCKDCDE